MKDGAGLLSDSIESTVVAESSTIDWRLLAGRRLNRLVALEHDCVVIRDRLDRLQTTYGLLLNESDRRTHRMHHVGKLHLALSEEFADLTQRHTAILASRSWRMTRPLRWLSSRGAGGKRLLIRILRALSRRPLLRRVAGALVRRMPGLHRLVRTTLFPKSSAH